MKHTSSILEPSIPFHTLVKFNDAEDIDNDKIRTRGLTLEPNNITYHLQTQSLDPPQTEQLKFTQPKDPNNKPLFSLSSNKSFYFTLFQKT